MVAMEMMSPLKVDGMDLIVKVNYYTFIHLCNYQLIFINIMNIGCGRDCWFMRNTS